MLAKGWFIFWVLVALFICVPIVNTVVNMFTEEGGVLEQTFNASDVSSWNTTGQILTENQTDAIGLTVLERMVTQWYVPLIAIFLVVIVFFVLGMGRGGGGAGEM